jgi:hypothetical protein
MKRRRTHKTALALLAAALLLAGCGHTATTKDPFVGTWHQLDPTVAASSPLIITKAGGGYLGNLKLAQTSLKMPLGRRGNELVGYFQVTSRRIKVVIDYLPATGHLAFRNAAPSGGMSPPVEFGRVTVSGTTTTASP